MMDFKYKTKNNVSPQGKPRVYFCCHHEDFEKYFETISDEILAKQNCAIWYVDEPVEYDEDFFENLKHMQLFVMPVTTNLLSNENPVLDVEFQFAVKNHIPVLPLMQESGLEELFNNKCGDLQFLDKYNTDTTAISYDEKLQKYLESVLIGDELAGKIRAAFDAYIFLSYRKKDRKYAQELMKLIHKNDFCRDIAIWYDEFLTPGENFNDSIKEALQKSGLFVLTVTPNLVNEINYIMTTEYPMAKQEGKIILPAEIVPTDREQLFEKYKDIPEPADAHNDSELSDTLLESIKKIAIKENDASPEHNFFIGLAYLGGIDVEIDYERAVELITSAADAGLEEALEKLSDMYLNGIGVERDLEKAGYWRKRKVELFNNLFSDDMTEYNLMKLCNSVDYLCDFYSRTLFDMNRGLHTYRHYSDIVMNAEKPKSFEAKRALGLFFMNFANICLDSGDMVSAEKYLNSAESIIMEDAMLRIEKFEKSTGNIELFKQYTVRDWNEFIVSNNDLSLIYESLGILYERKCMYDKYEQYLLKTFDLRKTTCKYMKGDYKTEFNMIIAYHNLADFYVEQGNYEKAEKYISEGSEAALQLANESGSLHAGEIWVRLLNLHAVIYRSREDFDNAKKCYTLCIFALKKSKKTPKLIVLLAQNLILLSEVLIILEEYDDVLSFLNESKLLLHNAGIIDEKLSNRADALIRELSDNTKVAQLNLKELEQTVQKIGTKTGFFTTDEELYTKFVCLSRLAFAYFKLEMHEKAEPIYILCLKFGEKLIKRGKEKQLVETQIYTIHKNLSEVCISLGKEKECEKSLDRLIKFGREIARKGSSNASTKVYLSALNDAGLIYRKMNNIKKAKKCFVCAIDKIFKLMKTDDSDDILALTAELLFNDAILELDSMDVIELKNSRSLWLQLAKAHPDNVKYSENVEKINLLLSECEQ